MDSETWVRYAKQRKAQALRRLREMVSENEFKERIEGFIGLGQITAEEVAAALILEGSVDTIETDHITRAIELVTEHGVVTGAQLHALLGLEPDDHPSEILAEALEDGRLIKEGKEWMLGVGPAREVEVITYLPTPEAVAAFPRPMAVAPAPRIRTRVELAIEFLKSQPGNRATNSQMQDYLGVTTMSASAMLRTGLERRALARDGKDWLLGPCYQPKVDEVVNFIKAHPDGRARHAEVCMVLGLDRRSSAWMVDSHLRIGVESALLARVGKVWVLGTAAKEAA